MIVNYIHADSTRERFSLNLDVPINREWLYIDSKNKFEFIKHFLPAFYSFQKIILFDPNHKQLLEFYKNNRIEDFERFDEVNEKAQLLFFTSGSSGFPVGAFKTRENLLQEIEELKALFREYSVKKVVVTVPFVHIYGVLAGLLLPMSLGDVELVVKEDFLPYELLKEAEQEGTLVVTTPVFIKALGKLEGKSLSRSVFISSTGPLQSDDVSVFETKYETKLIQLFGSTETGGIAYKIGADQMWNALPSVQVTTQEDKLSVSSPFISQYIVSEGKIELLSDPFTTEDIIELQNNRFELIGRGNKIIKIAGKRISATYIENILETIEGVEQAVVELVYKKELLRSEQILIKVEAKTKIDKQIIKAKIAENFGVLTIPFRVEYVDKITRSAMGKKIIFS
jgi:acyl-coenzyme A synthetase/AMP-(fatty) acid ligase